MNDAPTPDGSRATERLVELDRIQNEARMLPQGKKLTAAQIRGVRAAFQDFNEGDNGGWRYPLARVAKDIDRSPSVVSQWLADKYKGDVDSVTRLINLWIERVSRREQSQHVNTYVETWVCEEIAGWVRHADKRQKMAAIVAPAGSGKDMIIKVLAEEMDGHIIYCDQDTTSRELLKLIAATIGLKVTHGSAKAIQRSVVNSLKGRSTILFLNEAHQLHQRCASTVRSLFDQTGVPIIMIGASEIFSFVDDRVNGGGQFARRCLMIDINKRLGRTADPDNPERLRERLCSPAEIRRFLAMKKIRLADDDVLSLLTALACADGSGAIDLVNELVETVVEWWPGELVTRENVLEVLASIRLGEHDTLMNQAHLFLPDIEGEIAAALSA